MLICIESNPPDGKKGAAAEVEAEKEVVVVIIDNRVEEIMKRNNAHSMEENISGENAQRTGEAMLIKRSMGVAKDEAEVTTAVVIRVNHITCNSMSIYLLLLRQDKELYHLLWWLL